MRGNGVFLVWHLASVYPLTLVRLGLEVKGMHGDMCLPSSGEEKGTGARGAPVPEVGH